MFFRMMLAFLLFPIISLQSMPVAQAQSATPNSHKNGIPEWSFSPLTIDQQVGQAIWFMSAPNYRYHTYTLPQRVGGGMNFWNLFRTDRRYEERYESGDKAGKIKEGKEKTHLGRWSKWGLMNDPDCCQPGKDCEEKAKKDSRFQEALAFNSPEKTFGLDYCIGDKDIIEAVKNKSAWKDPACNSPYNECNLAFGQPAGAVGFRKFPNPRFDAEKWLKLNGGKLDTWEGWRKQIGDASIEPPYLIGMSCAGCHVSFNPVKGPAFPDKPEWANLLGTFGSQYVHTSEIHASALPKNHPLSLIFASRPGITDTSAVPTDGVQNPGSMLSIINFDVKPFFPEDTYKDPLSGVLQKGSHRILKGGEDNVNVYNAIQRVYINIGVCAEECWLNNLTDITVLDPTQRNFLQTPLNVAQCYESCPSMKALTGDKNYSTLTKIALYLASRRPTDLKEAVIANKDEQVIYSPQSNVSSEQKRKDLIQFIETKFSIDGNNGKPYFKAGDVDLGRKIFAGVANPSAAKCASCHSTQYNKEGGEDPKTADFSKVNFWAEFTVLEIANYTRYHGKPMPASEFGLAATAGVRKDWLGNDELTPVADLQVNRCRSLHSNHMDNYGVDDQGRKIEGGHIWKNYASITYAKQADQTEALGDLADSGRGYMRNISLLSVWSTAPLLHNNSVGPEICLEPGHSDDIYAPAYDVRNGTVSNFDGSQSIAANDPRLGCWKVDPSPRGRMELFVASMNDLLNPGKRWNKTNRIREGIMLELGPKIWPVAGDGIEGSVKQKIYKIAYDFAHHAFPSESVADKFGDWIAGILGMELKAFTIGIPAGTPSALLGNLDHKRLMNDVFEYMRTGKSKVKDTKIAAVLSAIKEAKDSNKTELTAMEESMLEKFLLHYNNCTDLIENKGHTFGSELSNNEKRALTAFLLTL